MTTTRVLISTVLVMYTVVWAEDPVRPIWNAPGASIQGAPTRDGRFLTSVDPTSGDLALLEVGTGSMRRLTNKGVGQTKQFAWFSVPSPDASQVAVAWFNDAGFYELRVVAVNGDGERVLFRNEESGFVQPTSWTPDGKQILTLFFRKDNISQIALVDAQSGSVRILRSLNWVYPKRMQLSPDGRWIVYDSFADDRPGPRDIYILAVDGSQESRVVDGPSDDLFPVWSPDGKEILFGSDRGGTMDAWAIRIEDGKALGEPRCIRRNMGQFVPMGVTAKGDLIFGLRIRTAEIALIQGDHEPVTLSTRTPGRNSAPAWSGDGTRLAYLSIRGPENFSTPARVVVVHDMKSGNERDLPVKLATIASIRWSPDNEWLLASGSDGKGRAGLFRIRVRDGSVRTEALTSSPDPAGLGGDYAKDGHVIRADEAIALAVARASGTVARATKSRVYAGTSEWAIEGVTWLEWKGDGLLAGTRATPLLLNSSGVRKLFWKGYDGGPFSIHPDRETIAIGVGGMRSEVWVMEHAFQPVDRRP
ncbi:MAG: hypothetical protein SGI92_15830 [Bryobacteraceae bacterium]|nr:hypothetical protein [Bryobacteraceae bacterium]